MTPKKRKKQFDKLFAENKHHFDMTCDECSKVFKSLEEARAHYAKSHNNPHGYIKCCKAKMKYPSTIERHLQRHMNPEKYTYVNNEFNEHFMTTNNCQNTDQCFSNGTFIFSIEGAKNVAKCTVD